MSSSLALQTRPLSASIGVEILDVDLSVPVEPEIAAAIRAAWIDAGIVLFRGAGATDDIQMRLSEVFGEMEPAATASLNRPDNPYLMTLAYDPAEPQRGSAQHYNIGGIDLAGWLGFHWDQSFMPTIVHGAVLCMKQPSARMGETGFIDAIDGYERLSGDMQARIEGLEIVYEFNPDFASGQFGFPEDIAALPRNAGAGSGGMKFDFPPVVHPLVITQAETGRKVLKLSPMHARYVLGMDRDDSDALLEQLARHLCDPRYVYWHQWQKDDMIAWDNWRVLHGAAGVPLDCTRIAQRTTIMGDYNVGRYLDPELDRNRTIRRIID